MKCSSCEKNNQKGAKFCEFCGEKMFHENQDMVMRKITTFCMLIISFALVYYFFYKPYKKQQDTKDCFYKANSAVGWDGKKTLLKYDQERFNGIKDLCMQEKGY